MKFKGIDPNGNSYFEEANTMNKKTLTEEVWKRNSDLRLNQIYPIVASIFDIIEREVARGGKVTILGFGTFESRLRDERKVVNPRTGEPMILKAKKYPAFRAGKGFKSKVESENHDG